MGEQHRIRTDKFCLTLLPEERAYLDKGAFELGLTRSEYLRRLVVFGGMKGMPLLSKEETNQIIQELSKIGNELSQIAYGAVWSDPQEWEQLRDVLYAILARLGELPYIAR